jgi:peptidoglycan/LPS O-acetylase OafA/YrhL
VGNILQFYAIFLLCALAALVVATVVADLIGRFRFPLPPEERRLGCVDGLRGYLALAVLTHHVLVWILTTRMGVAWGPLAIPFFNQLGVGAVGLFFMTTGLVFYPRVLAGLRRTPWLTVYISRLFRIVPLVTVGVGIITVIIMARTGAKPDLHYIGAAVHWISSRGEPPILGYPDSGRINAYVLWSLWYEWLFYLFLLPICAGAMDLVRALRLPSWVVPVALFVIGVGIDIAGVLLQFDPDGFVFLPVFAIGMLAFELQLRPKVRAALSKPYVAVIAAAGLLLGMATTAEPYFFSLPLFGFFFICVACGNGFGGILRSRGSYVLGECSFGIYVLHGIVLDVLFVDAGAILKPLGLTALPLLAPVAAVVVALVTAATFLLVERPAIQTGKRFSRWLALKRAVPGRVDALQTDEASRQASRSSAN